jgi:zinc protease
MALLCLIQSRMRKTFVGKLTSFVRRYQRIWCFVEIVRHAVRSQNMEKRLIAGEFIMSKTHSIRRRIYANIALSCMGFALVSAMPSSARAEGAPPAAVETSATSELENGWGIAVNDLKPDPAIRLGTLSNGMKYALQKNATPQGAAAVRLNFDIGGLEEGDDEAGLAHFLEHMAFNGSTRIPEGELVKKLERLGLAFGADTNAETWPDKTLYKLDLPNTNAETVDAALLIMREIASELTLSDTAIERERGIILTEEVERNSPDKRRSVDLLASAFPDSKLTARLKADVSKATKSVSAEQIRSFYRGYYRPERATLIMVGDFDIEAMERDIIARFQDWKGKGQPSARYLPETAQPSGLFAKNYADPTSLELIFMQRVMALGVRANTVAEQRHDLLEAIATDAMMKRITNLSLVENPPIVGGAFQRESVFRTGSIFGIIVLPKDDSWKRAMAVAEQEMRRASLFGFTQSEVDEAIVNIRARAQNATAQATARDSKDLATNLVNSTLANTIVMAPADQLTLYEQIIPTITKEDVGAHFRALWGDGANLVHFTSKTPIEGFSDIAASTLADSAKVAVSAPEEAKKIQFAYDDFGKAGKIKSDTRIADLGIRTITFANGARLNIKKTDFQPGAIQFGLRVGSGAASFPADKPGLAKLVAITQFDGFEKHGIPDLISLLAGKTVKLGVGAGDGAFESVGATTPNDLDMQLKLLAATLMSLGYRPETAAQWPDVATITANSIKSNPAAMFNEALPQILSGGDTRFGLVDPDILSQRSYAEVKAAIDAQLKKGPLEVALVGDIDEEKAIAQFAATLGALPKRAMTPHLSAAQKKRSFTKDRSPRVLLHDGAADQGIYSMSWPTGDDGDLKSSLARDTLARVFALQMTDIVREKLGATYTPQAFSNSSADFPGFGHITAFATATPDKMEILKSAFGDIAKSLREQPISDDVLQRARQPVLERYERQLRDNGGWVSVVNVAQSEPERLERRRTRAAILAGLTPADIQAMAQQYLRDDEAVEIRVVAKAQPTEQ